MADVLTLSDLRCFGRRSVSRSGSVVEGAGEHSAVLESTSDETLASFHMIAALMFRLADAESGLPVGKAAVLGSLRRCSANAQVAEDAGAAALISELGERVSGSRG